MNQKLTRKDLRAEKKINFQVYGVSVEITADKISHLEEIFRLLSRVFPNGLEKYTAGDAAYQFTVKWNRNAGYKLYLNEEELFLVGSKKLFFEIFESRVRLTIAEYADSRVFLHAGVVGWKGRAIIIPATSFSGKSTLVAELVKRGAAYYSDEYAVLDADGNVEPFPKWLSIREKKEPFTQIDYPVEAFGGAAGVETLPVGMVLVAKFDKKKKVPLKWKPQILSHGEGVMEILPHTLPIRNKPEFVLKVLNKLASRAIIVKTVRGEAVEFARILLSYFDSPQK